MQALVDYLNDFPKEAKKHNNLAFVMTGDDSKSPVDIFVGQELGTEAQSFSFRTSVAAMIGLSQTFIGNLSLKKSFKGSGPEDYITRDQLFTLFEKAKKLREHGKKDEVINELAWLLTNAILSCVDRTYKNKPVVVLLMMFQWSMDLLNEDQLDKLFENWTPD